MARSFPWLFLVAIVLPIGAAAEPPAAPVVAPVRVAVAEATRGPVRAWLRTEGTARSVQREILHFGQAGKVVEIGLDADGEPLREGSPVVGPRPGKAGQFISRIDARDVGQQVSQQMSQAEAARQRVRGARSAIAQATSAVAHAEQQLARTRELSAKGIVPRKQLDEAEGNADQARARLQGAQSDLAAAQAEASVAESETEQARIRGEQYVLRAPFDGVISFLNVSVGDFVAPLPAGSADNAQLMRLAAAVVIDPSAYEVVAEIPSIYGLGLRRGMTAEIAWAGMGVFEAPDSSPDGGRPPVVKAEVFAVAPAIAPDSRTIRIRLRTVEPASSLRDGLYVAARVLAAERREVIRIPVEASRHEAGVSFVYVVDRAKGVAERRVIKRGLADGRHEEIIEGLAAGEIVVVAGQERLSDGTPVATTGGTRGS
jgi:RND family efflux transporter MFP subunit